MMPTAEISWISRQGVMILLIFAVVASSLVVLQQQRTIEAQRTLIHQLFSDSVELTQLKMKQAVAKNH
jgi:hypothetical protein